MSPNKIRNTKHTAVLLPGDVTPEVHLANYMQPKPGEYWGVRTIDDLELILIASGRFRHEVAGGPDYEAGPGDVVWIEPDVRHTFRHVPTPEESAGTFSCIHLELTAPATWRRNGYRALPAPPVLTHTLGDPVLHDLFRRAAEAWSGYAHFRTELVSAIVKEIWIRLSGLWEAGAQSGPSVRMQAMQAYLRKHAVNPVGRHDLAREFSITPEHVDYLFKKELGMTPTDFLLQERIHLAYQLLRYDGCSVKEAGMRSGFNDQFYFSRAFKRLMKMPPSAVKERMKAEK